jgi:hypothetical protein
MSACFGRPAVIRSTDFDTPLPVLDNFSVHDTQSKSFIQIAHLCIILGNIADYSMQREAPTGDEMAALIQSLCN